MATKVTNAERNIDWLAKQDWAQPKDDLWLLVSQQVWSKVNYNFKRTFLIYKKLFWTIWILFWNSFKILLRLWRFKIISNFQQWIKFLFLMLNKIDQKCSQQTFLKETWTLKIFKKKNLNILTKCFSLKKFVCLIFNFHGSYLKPTEKFQNLNLNCVLELFSDNFGWKFQ